MASRVWTVSHCWHKKAYDITVTDLDYRIRAGSTKHFVSFRKLTYSSNSH